MRPVARLLAAAVLVLCAASPAAGRPKVNQLPPSTRVVLDNGLEAILIPNGTAPLVTSVAVVRTGSIHESAAISGVSHMLEHLLFSGTSRRTQQDIAAAPGRFGLVNNAHTAAEHTAYFVLAPREQFAEALDLQADMLLGSTIPEERLVQEREIIANEIAKDQVQDETMLSELYAARLYPGGLALPVIGTPDTVRSIPREAVMAAYRTWYVPNNMTLIVMGDFHPDEMEALVRRLFGRAAPGLLPAPPREAPEIIGAALGRRHTRRTGGSARRLWMAAPSPGMEDPLFPATRMLARLLDKELAAGVNARLAAAGRTGTVLEAEACRGRGRDAGS
jgi:predicted Zn-dependent peptidase